MGVDQADDDGGDDEEDADLVSRLGKLLCSVCRLDGGVTNSWMAWRKVVSSNLGSTMVSSPRNAPVRQMITRP